MDKKNKPKLTKLESEESNSNQERKVFKPTEESKGKAIQLRIFAIISWILAVGVQIFAISILFKAPVNMVLLIVLIAIDLLFAVIGSILWKKSNRFDPASEKNKFLFFMQNQLGLVVAIIAFLPLVIFIFTSKNLDGKQKGIAGGIAVLALLIAGVSGIDFTPPSVEQYTEQSEYVESLNNGLNHVFWTKSGTVYHIHSDCSHINSVRTSEIFQGSVAQARELKNITSLCSRCENRSLKEIEFSEEDANEIIDATEEQFIE